MKPRVKVCGITKPEDGALAFELGASCIGMILYAPSPRSVSWEQAAEMCLHFEARDKVYVDVMPDLKQLQRALDCGFQRFQIHFDHDTDMEKIKAWSDVVGKEKLCLAPKLPPEAEFPQSILACSDSILMDTYSKSGYGGSGHTGNWAAFADLEKKFPEPTWILAGGLSPENIIQACEESGASFVDVNSGVEQAPGIKDATKLKQFFERLP